MKYLALIQELRNGHPAQKVWSFAALSAIFALFGSLVRGVTRRGAVAGAFVCFTLLWAGGIGAFAALLVVFLLTWISTHIGYGRKQRLGTAEARGGRNALQVLANLGTASGCAILYATVFPDRKIIAALAAALTEAAADTVSSEIGQALGGTPRLLTNWQPVAPGTDGALTILGTLAGSLATIAVSLVFVAADLLSVRAVASCAAAGFAGMIFDSFLGATLERRHVLGNNGVNFSSTLFAAVLALLLLSL